MKHTYNVSGMTCSGCQKKVTDLLMQIDGIKNVDIDLSSAEVTIEMSRHIDTATLQRALKDYPKYQLSENHSSHAMVPDDFGEKPKTWLQTYKPILLIFVYVLAVSVIVGYNSSAFDRMLAMRVFMAGFFLVFSFFKLLDLGAFADSYMMYDVIARKFKSWGYLYAIIELLLGIAYAINFNPLVTSLVTVVVMGVSIIGVLQSVLNKRAIRCACLGAIFNLPMSTVTIVEDGLMIAMSGVVLVGLI